MGRRSFGMKSRILIGIFLLLLGAIVSLPRAVRADVRAEIDLSEQLMRLYVDGALQYEWPVSTARRGYRTPLGTYRPIRLERSWFSRKYDMSPMPHSVFFHGGYAIHGTNEIRRLGRPVSHGCIRLAPKNASYFFNLVHEYGPGETRIVITR